MLEKIIFLLSNIKFINLSQLNLGNNNNFISSNPANPGALENLLSKLSLNSDLQFNLLMTLFTIAIFWAIRFIIIKIVWKRTEKIKLRYSWKKTSGYVTVGLTALVIGVIWIKGFESLATILGLASAGLILLLKDPILNFAGWVFIMSKRQVEVGDRIQVNEFAGDVIDINIFYFTLMEIGNWVEADQSTGRIMYVPNSFILNQVFINYTKGLEFLWNEIQVVVTFESDWKKAKKILTKIIDTYEKHMGGKAEQKVKEAASRYYINYSKFTPIVYTDVIDYGIKLSIRYLCEPRNRRPSEAELWEKILVEFKKHDDIDFAYPTQRFYNNSQEGKMAMHDNENVNKKK